jgi:cytoskeletal protein RodZ
MQTVGDILKQARTKKKLTFTELSSITKIPKSTLIAIEKNQLKKLPSQTYLTGFIKNYAQVVGLDPVKTIAIFRRDNRQTKKKKIIPKGLTQPLNSPWQLNPTLRTIVTLSLITLLFFAYLGFSIFKLYQPPRLALTQPENAITTTSPVLIKGQTNRDSTLTLNGKTINLEPDGHFTTVFNGSQGTHELKLTSTSRRNKSTTLTRHLIITTN